MADIVHYDLRLSADPSRVVMRPFHIAPEPRDVHAPQVARMKRIVDAVMGISEAECERQLADVNQDFSERHWQTEQVYLKRFEHVANDLGLQKEPLSTFRRELIGAYFCHEYSYAAAAIMNPSGRLVPIVPEGPRRAQPQA